MYLYQLFGKWEPAVCPDVKHKCTKRTIGKIGITLILLKLLICLSPFPPSPTTGPCPQQAHSKATEHNMEHATG